MTQKQFSDWPLADALVGKSLLDFGDYFKDIVNYSLTKGSLRGLKEYCERSGDDFDKRLHKACKVQIELITNRVGQYYTIIPFFVKTWDVKLDTPINKKWTSLVSKIEKSWDGEYYKILKKYESIHH